MTGLMCSHPHTSLEILLGLSLPQSLTTAYLSPQKSETNLSLSGLHFILLIGVFCTLHAPHPLRVPSSLLRDLVIFLNPTEAIQQFHFPLLDCQLPGGQNRCGIQLCFPRHLAQGEHLPL